MFGETGAWRDGIVKGVRGLGVRDVAVQSGDESLGCGWLGKFGGGGEVACESVCAGGEGSEGAAIAC